MPAPITHIFFAEKILQTKLKERNRRDFFVGTSFPDFRYFDNLDRQLTHRRGLKFEEIEKTESFFAGFLFHSFLDELWANFYFQQPDYPFVLEPKRLTGMSLKFLEDEIYYSQVADWPEKTEFFKEVLSEELNISESSTFEEIISWHKILVDYFKKSPDDETRRNFLRHSEITDDLAKDLNQFIFYLRHNRRVNEVIGEFYDYFLQQVKLV